MPNPNLSLVGLHLSSNVAIFTISTISTENGREEGQSKSESTRYHNKESFRPNKNIHLHTDLYYPKLRGSIYFTLKDGNIYDYPQWLTF